MIEAKIRKLVEIALRQRITPGGVIGVTDGHSRLIYPFGSFTYGLDACPVERTTMYDVASITKVVPTSLVALMLCQERTLHLQDRVRDYLPELTGQHSQDMCLWHLLTQTLEYECGGERLQLSRLKDKSPQEMMNAIFGADLARHPGCAYAYSNTTSLLLGLVMERAVGKKLDEIAQELLFQPLDMRSTTFHPEQLSRDKFPPTEEDGWRGLVQGLVHDESAYVLQGLGVVGSAGLFASCPDLLNVVEMVLNDGVWKNKHLLKSDYISLMFTNQTPTLSTKVSLGWELEQREFMGDLCSERTIGKTGFTGCFLAIDGMKRRGVVFLNNATYPHRPKDRTRLNKLRQAVCNEVFGG